MNIWPATVLAIEIELPIGFVGLFHKTFTPQFSRFLLNLKHLRIVINREGQERQVIEANNFFNRVCNTLKWSIELIWEEKETRELSNFYSLVLYYEENFDYRAYYNRERR